MGRGGFNEVFRLDTLLLGTSGQRENAEFPFPLRKTKAFWLVKCIHRQQK
jgi:hypothetical protein